MRTKKLFSFYKKDILVLREKELENILSKLKSNKKVALTCFEREHKMCHRHVLTLALKKTKPSLDIKHL